MKGPQRERWYHAYGCRRWFNVARDSVTHDDDATVREAAEFQKTMAERVEAEVARLRPFDVRAIVGLQGIAGEGGHNFLDESGGPC